MNNSFNNYLKDVNIGFTRNERNGIVFYTVPAFEKYVNFAFCGDSKLSFKAVRGADEETVKNSFAKLCNVLDMPYESCTMTNIVHGDTIAKISNIHKGLGVSSGIKLPPCDGLITVEKGIPIASTHADCTPVAFYDIKNNVGCVVHAGWRGVLAGIHKRAVETFIKEYSSDVHDLLVAVGPAIHQCCFEVDKDVTEKFTNTYMRDDFVQSNGEKDKLDLLKLVVENILEFNIPPQNITVDNRCTACVNSEFTSYRREKDKAGTMVQIMCLK